MTVVNAFKLSQTQLRQLSIDVRPTLDGEGKVVLAPNPDRKFYRFADGNPGAPIGFRVCVGPRKAYYEIRVKKNGVLRNVSLGGVQEINLKDAHMLANEKRRFIVETGRDPEVELRIRAQAQEREKITFGEGLDRYLSELEGRLKRGRYKQGSLKATRDAIARFDHPRGLRGVPIIGLSEEQVEAEFYRIRHACMLQSKLLPLEVKDQLSATKEWWHLTKVELVALGLTGKMIELAHSAGLAGAERAMKCARTAMDMLIESERIRAIQSKTTPAFFINPFDFLARKEFFRSKNELQKHYADAEVRNPLSEGEGFLQSVMKALIIRRGWREDRRVATDYLFLTMLWGCRRSESASLRWFDSLSKGEIQHGLASWVWIADDEQQINPKTKCRGSQVFFHDTKNGQHLLLPIAPFAKQLLLGRLADRAQFQKVNQRLREHTKTPEVYDKLLGFNERWVFPARKTQSKTGFYTVSNAIFHNLRVDAGLLDPEQDRDIGLAPHDLRRTLGRFAGKILPGHFVSQLLNHKNDDGDTMSFMSTHYSQQEWPTLREAMERVEASIIGTSPRVWNALRTPDMPQMDESDDPELLITLYNRPNGYDTKAQSQRRRSFPQSQASGECQEGARPE